MPKSKVDPAPLYDPRNQLNDLSSKEWTYALGSVLMTRYPAQGADSMAHHIRRKHPSPKPPQLIAELLRFFTKKHGRVLDPFCGAGSTLLACAQTERQGVGFDLNPDYRELYHDAARYLNLAEQPYHVADACADESYAAVAHEPFDLVVADPPYSEMLTRKRTGHRAKKGQTDATPFSDNLADLGNLSRDAFFAQLTTAMRLSTQALRHHGHLILFIKDLQPSTEYHNMLHADVVNAMADIAELRFRGYRIWHDANVNMFPFGYPYTFVANQTHQFILIFRKEQPTPHR
jgi:DNA modification methylase